MSNQGGGEMTEEADKKTSGKNTATSTSKAKIKIIIGVLLISLGVLAVIVWWSDLWRVVRGLGGLFLLIGGLIVIAIAKE